MKAVILPEIKSPLIYQETEFDTTCGSHEVLVQIEAAAINHRDVYITQGQYAAIQTPAILGSDGAGKVMACGTDAAEWLQKDVIINPNVGWGDDERSQAKTYQVLGMPTAGTMAEYIKVPADRLALRPTHLDAEQAAALPLAGLTAYRALFGRAQAQQGDKVLISGVGGGVALFALQFAVAAGLEVWVTSGKQSKIDRAIQLGAKGGVNYRDEDWGKQLQALTGGFDVIIDSAGGDGFATLVDLARPAARIAFYGGTHGKFTLSPQKLFWKQISLLGSTMGSDKEFGQMVAFVNQHKIVPVIDSVWPMHNAQAAFDHLHHGQQFGKVVLKP